MGPLRDPRGPEVVMKPAEEERQLPGYETLHLHLIRFLSRSDELLYQTYMADPTMGRRG